jgi:hypothetical protein
MSNLGCMRPRQASCRLRCPGECRSRKNHPASCQQRRKRTWTSSAPVHRGRSVEIDLARHPHLDHGYAVTSHSSQGQTAERVLVHVDTALGAKDLLNNRMAYVAISRGALDAQIFTDDRGKLAHALGRDISRLSALAPEKAPELAVDPQIEVESEHRHHHGQAIGM